MRLLASLLIACVLPLAAFAEGMPKAMQLISLERRALDDAGGRHLDALLSVPRRQVQPEFPEEPRYTRAWLDQQPNATGDAQWRCLTEALYFEARGETVKGQFAVAEVILNRVESDRFPDTVCGVIRQGTGRKYACQFTYTCDGRPERIHEPRAWNRMGKVAAAVLDGAPRSLTKGATHYHTTAVSPNWARSYTRTAKIGVHLFYRHTWRQSQR